jgi:hypothetical protein
MWMRSLTMKNDRAGHGPLATRLAALKFTALSAPGHRGLR